MLHILKCSRYKRDGGARTDLDLNIRASADSWLCEVLLVSCNINGLQFKYTTASTNAPAAYVFAHNMSVTASTAYYVSWNGAMEVQGWRVCSGESKSELRGLGDTVVKDGFETVFTTSEYWEWCLIERVDGLGSGIRNMTKVVRTFVLDAVLAEACDASGRTMAL